MCLHHPWLQTFCRRSHLQSHDTKQLATGFSNDAVTTRMTASTNMFHKMHLIRSASGRHDSKIFAAPAVRASPGITPSHSPSVVDPRALREPPAASASRYLSEYLASVESRYQAFIAPRNRIILVCLELRLGLPPVGACGLTHPPYS